MRHLSRPSTSSLLALGMLLAWGCSDNLTRPLGVLPADASAPEPLPCVPNLDGRIDAEEVAPALGVPVSYLISSDDAPRVVDLDGEVAADGRRVWDWSAAFADDRAGSFEATPIAGAWFEDDFPQDAFLVALDASGANWNVLTHDDEALRLHGVASAEEDPAGGKTLLVYDTPIPLFRYPLEAGAGWAASGSIVNGTLRGLPYAGKDTYTVAVAAAGRLLVPAFTFEQALLVQTHVSVQPAVGIPTSRRQASFLFECFGEVARAVSRPDEDEASFELATEVRRIGL